MSKLTGFYNYIKDKSVSVVGIGISNTPLIDFLLGHGAKVTARDIKTRESLGELAGTLEAKGVKLVLGEGYLSDIKEDLVFRAPGIRPDKEEFLAAQDSGSIITSEMELFFELCSCKIFAVTGSDGKTTTTTLTHILLSREAEKRKSGAKVFVGGNIGRPLLPDIEQMSEDDFTVVELSSFQLQSMKISPDFAAITNVTPNHLNWHTDMEEYTLAKENIFLHSNNKRLVLNFSCDATREMAKLSSDSAEIIFFSGRCEPDILFSDEKGESSKSVSAVFEKDGKIVRKCSDKTTEILNVVDIKLPGRHNVENYMTAIALTWGYVSFDTISEVAKTFNGVEHRCEFVRELDGVKYYNSSIDSSPTRTEAALRSFKQKVIIICGGYDKQIPYEPLAKPLIDCAKLVILTGATAPKIKAALLEAPEYSEALPIIEADSFELAVESARAHAKSGDIVILSPASASFDRFKNFEERGNYFKKLVSEL